MNKNQEKLKSFTDYCEKHPHDRFWQALRNWSGFNFIFSASRDVENTGYDLKDTFYIE